MIPTYLRTDKIYKKYLFKQKKDSIFHLKVVKQYKYWRIVKNEYPYDAIASRHDLLVPERQIKDIFLITKKEWQELKTLWRSFINNRHYDCILIPLPWSQTFKGRIHFHLIKIKVRRAK